jgi:NAD(P)H-hydrate epimerase
MDYLSHRDMLVLDINSAYLGVPREKLMESAGRRVYEAIKERFNPESLKAVVYCGLGNNGGDGFVVARYLARSRARVEVVLAGDEERIKTEEARKNYERLAEYDIPIARRAHQGEWNLVVDALLGTGIKGELREPYKSLVKEINSIKAYKVSVDLPSGLNSGTWVLPDLVVTFHRAKKGLEVFNYVVSDIGIPKEAETFVGPGDVAVNLGRREKEAKKGDYGRVVVVGGSYKYYGASILAAAAAMNSGVDLVYVVVPEENYDVTRSYYPDLIVRKYPGKELNDEGASLAVELMTRCDCMVLGPGLGLSSSIKRLVKEILETVKKPVVVDADAIKAVAGKKIRENVVLTPHRGEFRLLTGMESPRDLEERGEVVKKNAYRIGATILLKGPTDVIASPRGKLKYCSSGNPGMTVGGTGDVLAGLVGGFLAQGLSPFDAACCAAFVNGYAGDEVYEEKGYAFMASDLVLEVPYALKKILEFARS